MRAGKLSWAAMVACFLLVGLMPGLAKAALSPAKLVPTTSIVYKTTPQQKLRLFIFDPSAWRASDSRPAMVLFFGGGWIGGTPSNNFSSVIKLISALTITQVDHAEGSTIIWCCRAWPILFVQLIFLRSKQTSGVTWEAALRAIQPWLIRSTGCCPFCKTNFDLKFRDST